MLFWFLPISACRRRSYIWTNLDMADMLGDFGFRFDISGRLIIFSNEVSWSWIGGQRAGDDYRFFLFTFTLVDFSCLLIVLLVPLSPSAIALFLAASFLSPFLSLFLAYALILSVGCSLFLLLSYLSSLSSLCSLSLFIVSSPFSLLFFSLPPYPQGAGRNLIYKGKGTATNLFFWDLTRHTQRMHSPHKTISQLSSATHPSRYIAFLFRFLLVLLLGCRARGRLKGRLLDIRLFEASRADVPTTLSVHNLWFWIWPLWLRMLGWISFVRICFFVFAILTSDGTVHLMVPFIWRIRLYPTIWWYGHWHLCTFLSHHY